jgi:hypothetical protein
MMGLIAIAQAAPATTGSAYRRRFASTISAGAAVVINDANFPGLGAFLPGWVLCSSPGGVHPQITIDGGTTWQDLGTAGGVVWVDGQNVRLRNAVAAPDIVSVWPVALASPETVSGATPAAMGSAYRRRFARVFAPSEIVLINDANFPGLGAFLPGWVLCSSPDTVYSQITIDGGTTWQFTSIRGGLIWVDGQNVRLNNIVAQPGNVSVWPVALASPETVSGATPAAMGSAYRRRFARTISAGEAVVINDANFPGLGAFLPGWVLCSSSSDVHPQITIDGGTTWQYVGSNGGVVWVDGQNVRLRNDVAANRDVSVWPVAL